ncbi:MAG: 3D domain-containing protein [Patescibacteria group bacterium]|nr:3D domain-containing protein [Patescibacteria group bacterium]
MLSDYKLKGSTLVFICLAAVLYIFDSPVTAREDFGFPESLANLPVIEKSFLLASAVLPAHDVKSVIRVVATAYSSTPEQTDDTPFITASNKSVRDGIIANNMLAFGTKVRLPELFGDKVFVVEDRMHWRKSDYRIDIWFANDEQSHDFGVKNTTMEILSN